MIDQTLLVEVRTEELPPALLWRLGNDFPDALLESLRQTGFATAKSKRFCKDKKNPTNQKVTTQTITFATPRRLAALLENIPAESPPRDDFRRGPQLTACHDKDGAPTKALIGFMHSVGVTCEKDLTQTEDKERVYVAWKGTQPGKKLADELPILVEKTLLHLSAPRLMRWGGL